MPAKGTKKTTTAPADVVAPLRAPAPKSAPKLAGKTASRAAPTAPEITQSPSIDVNSYFKIPLRAMLLQLFQEKDDVETESEFLERGYAYYNEATKKFHAKELTPVPAGRKVGAVAAAVTTAESSEESGDAPNSPEPPKIPVSRLVQASLTKNLRKAIDSEAGSADSHRSSVVNHLKTGSAASGTGSSGKSAASTGASRITLQEFIDNHAPDTRSEKELICSKFFSRSEEVCGKKAKLDNMLKDDKKNPLQSEYRARCSKACMTTLPEVLFKGINELNFRRTSVEPVVKKTVTTKKTAATPASAPPTPREGLPAGRGKNLPKLPVAAPADEDEADEGEGEDVVDEEDAADEEAEEAPPQHEEPSHAVLDPIFTSISTDESIQILSPKWHTRSVAKQYWEDATSVVAKNELKNPVCVFVRSDDPVIYTLVGMISDKNAAKLLDPENEDPVGGRGAFKTHPILKGALLEVTEETDTAQVNFARACGLPYNFRNRAGDSIAIPGTPESEE